MLKLIWSGGREPFLTAPGVEAIGPVSLGRFGGTGGKNEDGALIWSGDDWILAVILDGHGGSASVEATLGLFTGAEARLLPLCTAGEIPLLQRELIALLTSEPTGRRMAEVQGETACLIAYQRGPHILWLSIGDNTLYLLHPELARLGQYTLTTRNFFEWIGERSSLGGPVPCFSTGVRQLRQGCSVIVLVTDGIQEMPGTPFEPPVAFAQSYLADAPHALSRMLNRAEAAGTRDSCTMIAWTIDNPDPALMPSA
jgi:hypothetical protein